MTIIVEDIFHYLKSKGIGLDRRNDTGSKFGINSGRVSKLVIWDQQRHSVTNYDRGWDVKPASAEQKDILQALLKYLEALPTWENLR